MTDAEARRRRGGEEYRSAKREDMPQPRGWRVGLLASLRRAGGLGETAVVARLVPRVPEKVSPAVGRGWWVGGVSAAA